MSRPEPSAGARDLRVVRLLWKTHRMRLILWGEFQVAATFPLITGLSSGTDPERIPDLVVFWVGAATISTVLFYPWLAHDRARRGL